MDVSICLKHNLMKHNNGWLKYAKSQPVDEFARKLGRRITITSCPLCKGGKPHVAIGNF